MRLRIFRFVPELDAFTVAPEYAALADQIGLTEWSPVVWIGRLFTGDNDFGEHWFDNWDERHDLADRAAAVGLATDDLLIIRAARFFNGTDGPCHPPELRARFWRDVLISLELSVELLFDEARFLNAGLLGLIQAGNRDVATDYIPDLESRIAEWRQRNPA